jgi:hypothetical protein
MVRCNTPQKIRDALAAKWYGFDVFWINRLGHPFEEIGEKPNYEARVIAHISLATKRTHWVSSIWASGRCKEAG